LSEHYSVKLVDGTSQVGGGTMPEVTLPTVLISFSHDLYTAEQLSKKLRSNPEAAIIARIQKDELILDLRTVSLEEESMVLRALQKV
ncbi:MAG: L-seryl-tRNA(Sec) selenium transferase, partial [Bacillota bacterium]|nr:L-seryl-tRNA(Sec) selenium transferase [Bacillota bacterium]